MTRADESQGDPHGIEAANAPDGLVADPLASDEREATRRPVTCTRCRTSVHSGCAELHGGCVSLGCVGGRFVPVRRVPRRRRLGAIGPPPPPPPPTWTEVLPHVLAGVVGVVVLLGAGFLGS